MCFLVLPKCYIQNTSYSIGDASNSLQISLIYWKKDYEKIKITQILQVLLIVNSKTIFMPSTLINLKKNNVYYDCVLSL